MFGNTVDLGIRVTSDVTRGVAGLRDTSTALDKVKGIAVGVAAAVGAVSVAAGAYGIAAVQSAGDLEQSIGAVDVVFKDSADQIHTWAQQAAQDVGLTRDEFNNLGTLIGTQLKNGGTAMEDLAPKTQELIGLGSDLSAMFGGTSREAVEALSSALKGERDPIERYGVSLKQATIDAKAAELGFEKVGNSLSDEAQQAATLALIMEQTADAHGTFAREADTLQGKQARFAAQMENTKAIIGTALLPIATRLFGYLNDVAGPAVADLAARFEAFVGGVDLGGWWDRLAGGVATASGALSGLQPYIETISTWLTGSLVPAVEGLAGSFASRFQAIAGIVRDAAAGIWSHIEPLVPQIQAAFTTVGDIVVGAIELITVVWDAGTKLLLAAWDLVGPPIIDTVGGIMTAVIGIVGPALDTISAVIRTVMAVVKGDWQGAWDGVKAVADGAWRLIRGIVDGGVTILKSLISGALGIVANLWRGAWDDVKSVASRAWDAITSAVRLGIDGVVSWFTGLPGRITGTLTGLPSTLRRVGSDMLAGLIGGIKSMAGRVVDSVKGVINDAIGSAKRLLGIASPSRVFRLLGQQTGQGFIAGLAGMETAVGRAGSDLVGAALPGRLPQLDAHGGRPGAAAVQITVQGALDPVAVARQIRSLLADLAVADGSAAITGAPA